MEWVETTGRTVEEAKDAALDQLGVDEQDAEFEVLEEPKTGLFGRLRSEARVRARVRPTRPRPKEDRRDKRRRGRPGGGSGSGSGSSGGLERSDRSGAGRPAGTAAPDDDSSEAAVAARTGGGAQARAGTRNGKRGSERGQVREREEGNDVSEDVSLAEQGDVARQFLDGLLQEFGMTGRVEINEVDEETVEVAVRGEGLGLLIGQKGATLSALQEVTRTVVQRQTGGRNGRLLIDVGDYRAKRREALERFTRQVAYEVVQSGTRRVLEPMSPADRKVVHDTVNGIDGVSTTSEGEEPRRRVVILPS
jgi:spoIIIJ-associated protein